MTEERDAAKSSLRRRMATCLAALEPEAREAAGHSIRRQVLDRVDRLAARTVMAFLSDRSEIDLDPTITALLERDLRIVVPAVLPERGRMVPARIHALAPDRLDRDRYGLRVPRPPLELVDADDLDLVLVPGIAFTLDGCRLGRGGGYYDRWLSTIPEVTPRLGVCHRIQVVDEIEMHEHDRRVDEVLVG